MIRPRIPMAKRKQEETSSVFDIAKGFSQVSEIANELETLKIRYRESIEKLDNISAETKEDVRNKIKDEIGKINTQFVRDALRIIDSSITSILGNVKADIAFSIQKIENKVNEAESVFAHIKTTQKGDKGDRGNDGLSPSVDSIIAKAIRLIPIPKNGRDGRDAFVNEKGIIEKLLKEVFKKGIDIKDIKNLEERLRSISSSAMLGGIVKGGQGSWKPKNLSGTIDGVNTVFTYTGDPLAEFSEHVYLNYTPQNPFTDYVHTPNTITYTVAPDVSLSGLPHIIRGM